MFENEFGFRVKRQAPRLPEKRRNTRKKRRIYYTQNLLIRRKIFQTWTTNEPYTQQSSSHSGYLAPGYGVAPTNPISLLHNHARGEHSQKQTKVTVHRYTREMTTCARNTGGIADRSRKN